LSQSPIGIVGGYGATGRAVAAELLKTCDSELLIGGRDASRLNAMASELGNRVSVAQLDVLDTRSLDDFCSRCSVVVNCGGPVMLLQDRVAQAALRARCHYVDPAGMAVVKERLLPLNREIVDLGLSFAISAGWMPGLTELLPFYAHVQAKSQMDSVESVSAYFSDSGEWSDNAMRDGAWYLRRAGLSKPGYFRRGEWVSAQMSEATPKIDVGPPVGLRRFGLYFMPETNELGRRLTDCDFRSYSYLAGWRNALAATSLALFPFPQSAGVKLLRGVFRRNRLPVRGLAVAHALGRSRGRSAALKALITFGDGRHYWMNGLALATTARMISTGGAVQTGVHFLFDAVDPISFMSELRTAGVRQAEAFEVCP
jgi:hypothetical protein